MMFVTGLACGLWIGTLVGFVGVGMLLLTGDVEVEEVSCGPSCSGYWAAEGNTGCWLDCPKEK